MAGAKAAGLHTILLAHTQLQQENHEEYSEEWTAHSVKEVVKIVAKISDMIK